MGRPLQKKLAKIIVENSIAKHPLNGRDMLLKAGYSLQTAEARPKEIMNNPGVREELVAMGFNEYSAKKVVETIMLDEDTDPGVRLKATDQVFKVHGSYAAEKVVNLNVEVNTADPKAIALAKKYEEELKKGM